MAFPFESAIPSRVLHGTWRKLQEKVGRNQEKVRRGAKEKEKGAGEDRNTMLLICVGPPLCAFHRKYKRKEVDGVVCNPA